MADIDNYYGTWKIVECLALPQNTELIGIEGTEFTLEECGDVTWNIPEDTEHMPFFNCETYELCFSNIYYLRFFGAVIEYVIEFQLDRTKKDEIQLTYEGWCIIKCERIHSYVDPNQFEIAPFSLLCALEEGYFSDLTICADNGKEFKVHKTILKFANAEIDWTVSPCALANLSEDVLYTILHYLYSECLPNPLPDEVVKSCLDATKDLPGFEEFRELCQLYLKNNAVLDQILTLVDEIHSIGDLIIDYFNGQSDTLSCSSASSDSEEVNFASNPSKLRYIIIQALRESAVAGVKILVLCDLFARRKHEICRAERNELIEYLKARLPDFMKQLHKLLEVIKISFGNLTPSQRMDIASYFVSDIENALDVLFEFVTETKTALEQFINNSSSIKEKNCCLSDTQNGSIGEVLGKSIKNALHMRELMKLRNHYERILESFMNLMHEKEAFSDANFVTKNRSVAKSLEQFVEEIPLFMLRTTEMNAALDEKLTFKGWKYWFKLTTSKLAWILGQLVCHRESLDSIIIRVDHMVSREHFTQSLIQLNLLDPPPSACPSSAECKSVFFKSKRQGNDVKSFHEPPAPYESKLAKNALSFLKRGVDTDMSFEIIPSKGSTVHAQATENGGDMMQSPNVAAASERMQCITVKAHCIVVSARCDWFRKALLSGMKESIDKKIVIHDTSPKLFMLFLEYLYGGWVETSNLSTEQLADLMQLSDRYELDCLKQITVEALKNLLDDDSALFLLGIADQFNSRALRTAALEFIAVNKDIVKSDVFYDLPEDLQTEVDEMLTWHELRNSRRYEELSEPQFFKNDSPSSVSSSLLDVDELLSAANLSGKEGDPASDSSSLEDLPLTQDSAQLEACVAQLRDIVGTSVPQEELVRVSLAADYDVNRALNFFFTRFT